jgi:hypothetical protein
MWAFALPTLLLAVGCSISRPAKYVVGPIVSESIEVPRDGAESAEVEVDFGAGRLWVAPESSGPLVHANCSYNWDVLTPRQETQRKGDQVRVELAAQSNDSDEYFEIGDLEDVFHEWQVGLHPDVPMDLTLNIGAVEGELDLSGLRLTDLTMDGGACRLNLKFDEPNSEALGTIWMEMAVSEMQVHGLGNANFEHLKGELSVGEYLLDFSGAWEQSARIDLESALADLELRLPRDIGVRVCVDTALADIEAPGFECVEPDVLVNSVYGETAIDIEVRVDLSLGDLRLVLIDSL